MSTPLNLTLARGPSVWDQPSTWPSARRIYSVAAGAALALLVTTRRDRRPWLTGLVLGTAATALLASRCSSSLIESARWLRVRRRGRDDRVVDRDSEDSFPASDPPQY